MNECACGAAPTANGRECPACFRERLGSVANGFTPTRSEDHAIDVGAGRGKRRRLEQYRHARAEGIQPEGTDSGKVDDAKRASDTAGKAFRADALARAADGR